MKTNDLMHTDHTVTVKSVINWLAAFLGIGTFLGFVNLAVGVLSAAWLTVQIYGYIKHELPMKRMRQKLLRKDLEQRRTRPAPLEPEEAGRPGAYE